MSSTTSVVSSGMHTAGIYADMTVDGPLIGTLVMIIDRAKNLPNRKTMGKQHPYCAARLGKEAKKTNTDIRGGQTPKWDQEIRFQVHDSPDYNNLKLSVFNDDKKTDLIGETWINLQSVIVAGGGQNDAWHRLSYRDKYAGEIRIEMSYYDSRAPAEGSVVGEGRSQSKSVKRRPLPGAPDSAASSPGPGSAFGPRDMGSRIRAPSVDRSVHQRASLDDRGQDTFRHSVHGSFPPRSTVTELSRPADLDGTNQYHNTYDSQSDFLPRLPPKTPSSSTQRYRNMYDARSSPTQGQTHLAHHQSLPNVRLAQFDRTQRFSTGDSDFRSRNASCDDHDQSFHEPILEDDPADDIAPLPPPPHRILTNTSPLGGSHRRGLPSPTTSSQYSPASSRDDYYQRQSLRNSVAEESPSSAHRRSQVFNTASPTQPSPLRRELPANPPPHARPLRHAHSSSFSGPSHSEYYAPAALQHPPMNRHSVSDPYANVSPTRSHPLSYETRRSQSPQSYRTGDRAEDGPRYNTANTPVFRPRAISPQPSPSISHQDASHSPRTRVAVSTQHTPARRSVASHTSPAGSRDAMPFSPDSFDVHNPAARSSPLDHNINPQKPFQVSSSPSSRGLARDTSEPILGLDGREVDPSDHLPVDVWAPEPDVKIPCKDYGFSDKGFGPRAAAPAAERPKRTSILTNVRSKLAGSSPTSGTVAGRPGLENASPTGATRTNASPVVRARGPSDVLAEIDAQVSYAKPRRSSGTYRHESQVDGYGCSPLTSSAYSDSRAGYRDHGYGASALEQELSQIDLGVSSRRGTVNTRYSDRAAGPQYGSPSGQMQMYQQGPGARRSYDDARYGYR